MKFSVEQNSTDVLMLRLSGDLIGEVQDQLLDLADDALKEGSKNCIINIRDLKYMNSRGMGILIAILTKFRNKGGDVVLVQPSEHVTKLLIMTKLENIFNIAASEEKAVQELKQ